MTVPFFTESPTWPSSSFLGLVPLVCALAAPVTSNGCTHETEALTGGTGGGSTSDQGGGEAEGGAPPFETSAPALEPADEQEAVQGETYRFSPTLTSGGVVNFSKTFGPDDVSVDPWSGEVTWQIPSGMPSESFHIGVQATNAEGMAETTWIVHVGVPEVVHIGGPGDPYPTLKEAFDAVTTAGTTFVVRDGLYTGQDNGILRTPGGSYQQPPPGTSSSYTTVIAETPGHVTLDEGAGLAIQGQDGRAHHLAFKGLFLADVRGNTLQGLPANSPCAHESCRPHHIKLVDLGVESDGATPLNVFRSDDVLVEGCYVFGGGRYKIATYQSSRVVLRRNLARYDRSNNEHAEPKGTYSIYTSDHVEVANSLAVDGDKQEFITSGQLAGEFTCPVTSGPSRVSFQRNIQLNSTMLYGNIDSQQAGLTPCEATIRDVVAWDVHPYEGAFVMTRGLSWFDHVTMGRVENIQGEPLTFFNGWPDAYARGITNSLLHDFRGGGMFYDLSLGSAQWVDAWGTSRNESRFGVQGVNLTSMPDTLDVHNTSIANITEHDPMFDAVEHPTGALRYLVRIEEQSVLSGAAADGGDLGATVMTLLGRSGTLHGDPDYASETNIPMWPFPHERLIQDKLAAYSYTGPIFGDYGNGASDQRFEIGTGTIDGARGFAATGQSLTNYVWGYLGHVVPPFNVHSHTESGSVYVLWDPPAPNTLERLEGFRIYELAAGEEVLVGTTGDDRMALRIENVAAGSHTYVVKALARDTGEESGYAYPTTVVVP